MKEKTPVSVGIDFGTQSMRAAFICEGMRTPTMVSINGESVIKTRVGFTRGKIEWGPAPVTPLKARDYFEGFKTIFFNSERDVQNPIWTFQRSDTTPMKFVLGPDDLFCPTSVFVVLLHKLRIAIMESISKELRVPEDNLDVDFTVSLPSCFNITQRHAIKSYFEVTGFPSVSLCEDTSATAMSYITSNNMSYGNLLVFSAGAGFTSAACFTVIRPCMVAIENRSSFPIGGMEVTAALFEKAKQLMEEQHPGKIDWKKPVNVFRLRLKCEESKQQLKEDNVEIRLESNCEEFCVELTPQHLVEACKSLSAKANDLVQMVLNESAFRVEDITDAIMVGGGSRVGPIESSLQKKFRPLNLTKGVVAEEAVARGAAILGWHSRIKSKNSPLAWIIHDPNSQEEISQFVEIPSQRKPGLSLNEMILPNFQSFFHQNESPLQIDDIEIVQANLAGAKYLLIQRVLDNGIRVTISSPKGDYIPLRITYSFNNLPRLKFLENEYRRLLNQDQSESQRGGLVNDLVKLEADLIDWGAKPCLCKEVYSRIVGKLNETSRIRAIMPIEELHLLQKSVLSQVSEEVKAIFSPIAEFLDSMDSCLNLRSCIENVFTASVKNVDLFAFELQLLGQWGKTMNSGIAELIQMMGAVELRSESSKWDKFVGTLLILQNAHWNKEEIDAVLAKFFPSLKTAIEDLLTTMEQKFPKFQTTALFDRESFAAQGNCIKVVKTIVKAVLDQKQRAQTLETEAIKAWTTIEEFLQNQSAEICNTHIDTLIEKLQHLRPQPRNSEGHSTL